MVNLSLFKFTHSNTSPSRARNMNFSAARRLSNQNSSSMLPTPLRKRACRCCDMNPTIKDKEVILGGGETPPGSGTEFIQITQANIHAAVKQCISGGLTTCCKTDMSYGYMGGWDTSAVTDMCGLFQDASGFNCDISGWHTDNVTNMSFMFEFASAFNGDIGNWNTANVQYMEGMFAAATKFNKPLNWDTHSVTNMKGMFSLARAFNQPLNWDTHSVTNMEGMFYIATDFNQPLKWNTANVKSMDYMFLHASAFNKDLSGWCVEDISSQPSDFSNQLMTHAHMPNWDASCICTDASGIKTDHCNVASGVKGCKIPDSSNICCANWLHMSGCIDSSGLCYVNDDMSLCGRPIDISCSPFTETLGGTIQAKSSGISCSGLSNIGGAVTNVNSDHAFGASGEGYYCCMSGSDMCNNIPGCLRDGSMNRASMVCVSGCEDITCKDVVDISNVGKWKKIAVMGKARYGLGLAATSNGKIYAVGGQDDADHPLGFTSRSAEVYDPKSNTWHDIADMSYTLAAFGLAAIDDKIYAVGGWSPQIGRSKRAEMYDPSTNTWTDISFMTTERSNFGLASLNKKLYAVGGYDDDANFVSSVEVYDPGVSGGSWVAAASMTTARSQFGIAALEASDMPADMIKQYPEGLLYVAGGGTAAAQYDTSGEFYDPSSNQWRQEGSLGIKSGLWGPGMAALHGKIYIVGGEGEDGMGTAVEEVYDVSSNGLISGTSTATSPMSEARMGLGLVALNGKLYAVGGEDVVNEPLNTGEVYTPYPS